MTQITLCDDIEAEAWEAMPRTIRVNEFCKHCGFQCSHGKKLIMGHNQMLISWGFKPD